MSIRNPQELFVRMLSDLYHGSDKTTKIYQELSEVAQDPNVKEALQARVFLQEKISAHWTAASN